ncbi:hypothetical protein CO671_30955 [Rhizobium sp. M10]|uniref:hypothetical protein n=1 Tax=Rhizobium sp. M10 TaxID=1324586 RepID=UPI000BE9C6FE|nr:hypothetical protein [Rhizobium sp. M10]PDT31495.1 hypothetical protein CO671_30955 [Rhizobium sp. M10]
MNLFVFIRNSAFFAIDISTRKLERSKFQSRLTGACGSPRPARSWKIRGSSPCPAYQETGEPMPSDVNEVGEDSLDLLAEQLAKLG